MRRRTFWGALCALLAWSAMGVGATVVAAYGSVSEPVPGEPVVFGHTEFDLATVGYEQTEHFISGTATAYEPAGDLLGDGRWTVEPSTVEEYETRIVVNRPVDPGKFNGTVVVEWFNVSGQADASPDWVHTHVELVREGYAWVGVSAQAVGMNQLKCGPSDPCPAPGDPDRYASLHHPGDEYSYDIFSQVGEAIRDQSDVVLGGLAPERLLAVGESQSAGRLVTYINAVHPIADVYDGFLVHSRGAAGAPLAPGVTMPQSIIRTDLDEPVLVFQAENDTGVVRVPQDDSDTYRLWQVAGTAHFDQYGLTQGAWDVGDRDTVQARFDSMRNPTNQPSPNFSCAEPINTGPQTYVLRAALRHLNAWVEHGTLPPEAPRIEVASMTPTAVEYVVDDIGNVVGGIRTPAVDAPVATLSGFGQTGLSFCRLFGTTTPLTQQQLVDRYRNHGGFVSAWNKATQEALKDGFILREDASLLRTVGAQSNLFRKG